MTLDFKEKLNQISKQIKEGVKPEPVTARTFIGWFNAQRRTSSNVWNIRSHLTRYELTTDPDFEYAYIDSYINFIAASKNKATSNDQAVTDVYSDPMYRIGRLASANKPPVSVKPDDTIDKASSLMLMHHFSQLPVMTSERDVKGIINWASLGSRLALGKGCKFVSDCMVSHKEISYDTYIFAAVNDIIANRYVLIRNAADVICGIVTTSDLSLQFRQIAEPALLLGEVENYIQRMIKDKYTLDELRVACDSPESRKRIESVSNLTLGESIRLLENPDNWDKLELQIDREMFIGRLDGIRQIRNDVMHFDPDGISREDVDKLRNFVLFMESLARSGAI